jgi:adenylate kinase family enzyme
LIFRASGSGTTTLGKEIKRKTSFVHFDVDDCHWRKKPPFQEKAPLREQNKRLRPDFNKRKSIIVSGSIVNWRKEWGKSFDLAIFIHLNSQKRMERLKNREIQRYGDKLLTDKKTQWNSKALLEWADQ